MEIKRGISLIILVITIIVSIIITTITIIEIEDVLNETKADDFAIELTSIEDKVKEYYLLRGSLPIKKDIEYTADELKEKLENNILQELLDYEIVKNNDKNNKFYKIDNDLLGLNVSVRGLEKEETDIYVVSSNSFNVYYLQGYSILGTTYFSNVLLVE